ncbi:alpha/beta fold hydrolase [Motilibacter aurantiacus]|uniref:alpha/beta fold hydrolase n=1 Tax=Motilibacter aurantiacus TaxID=2714955 RepID=UPI001408D300|nr:alpha/beta hydrolase [Motilibacter aurantiacus]NHC44362.1 alpha/beta hydrolase [Motilibacter aurantiacus]
MEAPDASAILRDGPWEHRMVAANGARFHVAEVGSGPLVLLLHGFPEFWWAWRHALTALAGAGYRAAAMDLRGFGASDKPPRGYDPATLATDIAGVVRSLGAADAVVVGHGLGGMLAWSTAVAHPKVVRRLCAVSAPHPRRMREALRGDPQQLRRSGHVLGFQLPVLAERKLLRDDAAHVEQLLRAWAAPGWPSAEEAAVYRAAAQVPGVAHCSLEYSRWAVRSLPRPDGVRFARAMREPVRVPVLHLHGAADRAVLPRSAQGSGLYVEAPYRWRLLGGVGHFPHEESPEAFAAELLGWLADPEPDR